MHQSAHALSSSVRDAARSVRLVAMLMIACAISGCQNFVPSEKIIERHDLVSLSIPQGPGDVTVVGGVAFIDGGPPTRPAMFDQRTCYLYRSNNTEPLNRTSKKRRHAFNYQAFVEYARQRGYDGYVIVGDSVLRDSRGRPAFWETLVVPFRYSK